MVLKRMNVKDTEGTLMDCVKKPGLNSQLYWWGGKKMGEERKIMRGGAVWGWCCGIRDIPPPVGPASSYLCAGSNPGYSTANPALGLRPGKVVEAGPGPWNPAHT